MNSNKKAGGRPPKFQEASRPVTVTLPERTLKQLTSIDLDRAKAIVKATDSIFEEALDKPPVEVVEVLPGKSAIIVGPSSSLKKVPWLRLVEIAPSRFLLAIPSGLAVESLEIALLDLIENLAADDTYERELLTALSKVMRDIRRQKKVSKAEILFVDSV